MVIGNLTSNQFPNLDFFFFFTAYAVALCLFGMWVSLASGFATHGFNPRQL